MAKTNTTTKKVSKTESKKDVALSVVTALRQGKQAVQVRWLGDARPTDEDKAMMRKHGLRFYKDADGACWASFKINLEDMKALVAQMGYTLNEEKTKKATLKASKKAEPKADTLSALEVLASLDEEKLAKLLKIAELLG